MRRSCPAAAAVVVLALAGCGGDDEPEVDPEADQELVDEAVLTVDDLPDGFTEEEPDDDDEDPPCIDEELDISEESFEDARTARSAPTQFESAEASVRARVNAFESDDIPAEVIDSFDTEDFLDCIEDAAADQLGDEGTITEFALLDPVFGDEATAYRVRVVIEAQGVVVESQTAAALVDDRFVVSVDVTALEGQIDESLMEDAFTAMADRIEAAD